VINPQTFECRKGRPARAVGQAEFQVDAVLPASALAPERMGPCAARRTRCAWRRWRPAQPFRQAGRGSIEGLDGVLAWSSRAARRGRAGLSGGLQSWRPVTARLQLE
jgi:hypothetical protein